MLDVRTSQSLANRPVCITEKGVVCSLKQLELSEKCEGYQQISILDLLSGKTSPEHSVQTKEKTSGRSCKLSVKQQAPTFLYLNLHMAGGFTQEPLWETVSALPGDSTMLNIGECPSVVRESTLSQILQANVPDKYSLSQRACAGILRRAEKRGKTLPSMLQDALMEVVGSDG